MPPPLLVKPCSASAASAAVAATATSSATSGLCSSLMNASPVVSELRRPPPSVRRSATARDFAGLFELAVDRPRALLVAFFAIEASFIVLFGRSTPAPRRRIHISAGGCSSHVPSNSASSPLQRGSMTKRSGGRILVDQLRIQGCDRIFTVPGESFLAVLDALHDTSEIDTVVCRQEGGVAYMADADGKMTGRPGVAFVTRGPGATNASGGVHVAFQDSTPMILFIGDVARCDRDREGFQEIDFPDFFRPIAKWAARIEDARRIPEYVARAYRVATAGRPGPVVLALPEDMLRDEVDVPDRPCVPPLAEEPDPGAVQAMFELLKEAASPVAIVGGADWSPRASHHFANFAFRYGIPVAAAFRRQDAIPNSCGVYAGNLGYGPSPKLQQRIRDADLILAVGPRLGEATTDGYTLDHPRPSRPDAGPRPPRPERARPRLSCRSADLRRHGRVRGDGRRMDRPGPRPLLLRRRRAQGMARLVRAQAA